MVRSLGKTTNSQKTKRNDLNDYRCLTFLLYSNKHSVVTLYFA